ncbi:uncharacterized protein [Malus domestica]|uniref:uncharacterized protein n=1 Tax=Malus domestica TaxID=3750 RepID=UPI003975629A
MGFREVLARCQFNDLGYLGNKFPWATKRGGGITVRLDRVLANQEWIDLFLSFRVEHLNPTTLDHIPILFEWVVRKKGKYKKAFRFEEGWTAKEGCQEAVQEGWNSEIVRSAMFQVTEKIKATRVELMKWAKNNERSIPEEIAETEDKLNSLFGQPFTETSIAQRYELYNKLHSLLAQEEAFWRQRSRENWLRLDDQNTKYQKVNRRRRANLLTGLFDDQGL